MLRIFYGIKSKAWKILDKSLIQKRFSRRLSSYSGAALVQQRMAEHLLEKVDDFSGGRTGFDRIFEFGCGAGTLTGRIVKRFRYREFFLNDLVPECESVTRELSDNSEFIPGDIEKISFPDKTDLVISGATLQWVEDIEKIMQKVQSSLASGGIFAFSTFAPGNLREVKDITGCGLEYIEPAVLEELGYRYFKLLKCISETIELEFDTPYEVLHHLRETGVSGLSGAPPGKGWLERFSREYSERFSRNGKVKLTYCPVYFTGRVEE